MGALTRSKIKAKKEQDEKDLLDQQTGLGYVGDGEVMGARTYANKAVRPVHFTSLFTGHQTVLI